jgi:hypothetical protein
MEGGGKAAAEEKGRKEGGEKRGNACSSFVKTNGRTEDGRCTSDQERNGAGDENGRSPIKTSYADVLATARQKVPLAEIGVESLGMRKSMTGGIIIRLPGDKDKGKASRLATSLAEVLDPAAVRVAAPNRTAELRVGSFSRG